VCVCVFHTHWFLNNHFLSLMVFLPMSMSAGDENVIVPRCKLHNDAYCDMSKDGRFLAVFVPSHNGFPDDSILAVYSLATDSFKQCLYTKCFGE